VLLGEAQLAADREERRAEHKPIPPHGEHGEVCGAEVAEQLQPLVLARDVDGEQIRSGVADAIRDELVESPVEVLHPRVVSVRVGTPADQPQVDRAVDSGDLAR